MSHTQQSVLITGGAGFIGSHLAETLLSQGTFVTIIDDLSTGEWRNIAHMEPNPNFRAIIASVSDRRLIHEEVSRCGMVYHLASAVGVKLIIQKPVETVQRIVHGTDAVAEACSKYRRPLLLTSTSEVYGKSVQIPFCEEDNVVMGATSKRRWAYAAAKALDEFLILAHHYQTSLPVFIVRLFNTVGPRQASRYGMVLPRFVEAALQNRPIEVYGTGQQSRCFCSVFDVVEGIIAVGRCSGAIGKVVNLGSAEEVTMTELADRVIRRSGSESEIVYVPYGEAYGPGFDDMQRRVPSLDRAAELIGWKPRYSLDDIIRQVIDDKKETVSVRYNE
ncbi:MAG: GDP-mannose 4,6-dehydratase [Planctomycetaceae bacterium]|nr:GDP-mannose 4,6-dehydratase [Planctomycetaceae bacterium]